MTKKELLEALKDYPETAEVFICTEFKIAPLRAENYDPDDNQIYLANHLMDIP